MRATLIVRVPVLKLEKFCQNDEEQRILDSYRRWSQAPQLTFLKKVSWLVGRSAVRVWVLAEPGVQFVAFVYEYPSSFNNRLLEAVRSDLAKRGADRIEDAREGTLMSEQVRDLCSEE